MISCVGLVMLSNFGPSRLLRMFGVGLIARHDLPDGLTRSEIEWYFESRFVRL